MSDLFRIFAFEMESRKEIENAVCEYFKVNLDDLYSLRKRKYPQGIARDVLMYMLFANGYKSYDIARWFGFEQTMVYRHCGWVHVALKKEPKVKEDMEKIQEILKQVNNGRI